MKTYDMDQRNEARLLGPVGFTMYVLSGQGGDAPREPEKHAALDVSASGMRFYDEHALPDDALLELRLQPQGGQPSITQYGRVKWQQHAPDRKGFDVGVQFVEAAETDRSAWLSYVNGRLEKIRAAISELNHTA